MKVKLKGEEINQLGDENLVLPRVQIKPIKCQIVMGIDCKSEALEGFKASQNIIIYGFSNRLCNINEQQQQ